MTDVVQGHCEPRFKKVADALAEQITSGSEVGAAIAIDIDGAIEKIFDVQCDGPDVLLLNIRSWASASVCHSANRFRSGLERSERTERYFNLVYEALG